MKDDLCFRNHLAIQSLDDSLYRHGIETGQPMVETIDTWFDRLGCFALVRHELEEQWKTRQRVGIESDRTLKDRMFSSPNGQRYYEWHMRSKRLYEHAKRRDASLTYRLLAHEEYLESMSESPRDER